jgi:hypothetical protein
LETDTLLDVDSGSVDWAYRSTPDGIVLIQALDAPEKHISVMLLNPQNGQVVQRTETDIEGTSLEGVAWHGDTAYVTVRGDLYAVDLTTLTVTPEWP